MTERTGAAAHVRELVDRLLGADFSEESAAGWLGGQVNERTSRFWRIEPESIAAQALLRFENLAHADRVMTSVELVFQEPWATTKAELVELFGDECDWLPYTHESVPKTLVFEVSGEGDAKGTLCVRISDASEDEEARWSVPSVLVRRIWGPRRA